VRKFVIPTCLAAALASICPAKADVIHLKNGDTIYADRVEQTATRISYDVGDNTFSIPRSKVASVETAPQGTTSAAGTFPVPTFTPETQIGGEQDLLGQVVHGTQVDRGALGTIESQGNAHVTAIAYYIAAKAEFQAAKYQDSQHDFQTALRYQDDNPAILTYYAALLVRMGNSLDGISYAEKATRIVPDSPDAFSVLGYAQFSANRLRDAIQSWKRSLSLRPDNTVQQLLARAERESSAERNYSERETGHFVLHFEGSQSSESFREQLLATLEAQYSDLARTFGGEPRSSIQVVLYTSQAFFDVTRAPAWIGALNDGNIRIPLQGLDSVTPDLARVLRHELTHSFVNQITSGRCPDWLNEGIAQMLEPRGLGGREAQMAALFKAQREIPLNMLEHGFSSLSTPEARLAYDESLGVVSFISTKHGMTDLLRILQQIGSGQSAEAALRSVLHDDYGSLENDYRDYLTSQFGG
jgi:tetratricopeptide (TPR) repeat protein